ncbi:ABC transporter permease [Pseudomonas sp. Fl4BN1]|uniref:ABC transporter permease n=1 Tax=Pseudomonas sp. Fl4BN1 TaxID=2697651 RepID=UPI0013789039|nr:ABC transporter permease [Pseudomonas sp. Fl4BN1]NBF09331.1 ABC transporter permease [Pseudomonas sp. Fl4BN1]
MKSRLSEIFFELKNSRNILYQLVTQQLILRYRRTTLGYLWTLINPLLMMSIMAIVFSTLFKSDLKSFAVFLFAGMIPWTFFNSVVVQAGSSFISNEGLIRKIYLPKIIFPASICFALLIDSALSFVALFSIVIISGGSLTWTAFFIPAAFILLFFFAFGIALIMSVLTVYFRDIQHVVVIAMQGMFFLSPILYKKDLLTGSIGWIVALNPFNPFIDLFRAPLYEATLPSLQIVTQALCLALISMICGLLVFSRQEKKIIFRL